MSVPYTDSEASEARQWSNRYGPPNAWTASFGTAARMIGRLLDERERLMAKQTVAAPGDDYIREWHEEFQRWKAVAKEKQDLRDHCAAAALTGLLVHANDGIDEETLDTPSDIAYTAYAMADAMLRCRAGGDCPGQDNAPNHDAAPAARADSPDERPPHAVSASGGTPSAASRDGSGTGDTQEPVAWEVFLPGVGTYDIHSFRWEAAAIAHGLLTNDGTIAAVCPLYRHPPCQDFSQKNLTLTDAEAETLRELRDEAAQYADEIGLCASEVRVRQRIIDGLLRRLGGGR